MKNIFIFIFMALVMLFKAIAWDFGAKANVQTANNDNVYSSNTSLVSDTYNTFGGYLQTKNDFLKFKLKAKTEKYKTEKSNDNYSTDLSAQYKHSKEAEFTLGIFKQVYNGSTVLSTDTTSDNSGGRFAGTLSNKFTKDTSGYFSFNGNLKKYQKIAGRNDKTFNGTFGIEHSFSSQLSINPEITIQKVSSTLSYYNNTSYGPYVVVSYTPNDSWEFFIDGSIARSNYSDRSVILVVKGKTDTKKEYQELVTMDVGAIYNFGEYFSLQAKYSKGKNNSNNTVSNSNNTNTSAAIYKANVLSLDLSVRI